MPTESYGNFGLVPALPSCPYSLPSPSSRAALAAWCQPGLVSAAAVQAAGGQQRTDGQEQRVQRQVHPGTLTFPWALSASA